jgi:hypothetical protein
MRAQNRAFRHWDERIGTAQMYNKPAKSRETLGLQFFQGRKKSKCSKEASAAKFLKCMFLSGE